MIINKWENIKSNWREEQRLELEVDLAKMIPIDKCKDRFLYRIKARNLYIGVYNSEDNMFIGIREKFGRKFLDSENHWNCEQFATVKPMEELEELPADILHEQCIIENDECRENTKLFHWLEEKEKQYNVDRSK